MNAHTGVGRYLILLLTLPALGAECALEYRLTAHLQAQPRHFEVEVSWDAPQGEHRVLPAPEWAGISDFGRAIRNLRPGTAQSPRASVIYEAVNDVANVDTDAAIALRDFYRNMVAARYFQFFGWAMLLRPEHLLDTQPIDVCFTFAGLPEDWSFATSLGDARRENGVYRVAVRTSPIALRSAVYLGGDFRIHRREIEGRPLVIAMRGAWQFDDAAFVDATAAVVRAHRAFWNDYDFPYYLISLLPNRFPRGASGGTGLDRAFAMHASNDLAVPGPIFENLIGHEDLHSWLPRRIGSMGANEVQRYWFSEGFTDYLNHRLLVASGTWTLEDYAAALNRIVLQYSGSRARNASNDDVAEDFWRDPAAQRMPYLRGELLALRWDAVMAAHGTSLQAALRRLRRDDVVISSNDPKDLATARLLAQLRADIGGAVDRDVEAYIEDGDTIPVDPALLGACFSGKHVVKSRPESGFITRPGIMPVAVTRPIPGTVNRRDSYFVPRAPGRVETMEFQVAPGARDDPKCKRWIEAD